MERINFKRNFKLFAACEKAAELSICHDYEFVYLLNGYAYASDRHILVRIPLSVCTTFDPEDIAKLDNIRIHASLLKTLYGFNVVSIKEDYDAVGDTYEELQPRHFVQLTAEREGNQISVKLYKIDKHPNFEEVLKIDGDREPIKSLGVRAKLLGTLADAMGSSTIKMRFTQANRKVFIQDMDDAENSSIGLIMPVIVDEPLPGFED